MRTINQFISRIFAPLLLGAMMSAMSSFSGCGQSESQAVKEIATQAMREQADQNNRIADATRDLVSSDARAREELIESHAQLQQQLQQERGNLDRQRKELGTMREAIELDRRRAPVIANAIIAVGVVLGCLCPLALAAYVLHSVNRVSESNPHQLVNELLIGELTGNTPLLLPAPAASVSSLEDGRCEAEQPNAELPF